MRRTTYTESQKAKILFRNTSKAEHQKEGSTLNFCIFPQVQNTHRCKLTLNNKNKMKHNRISSAEEEFSYWEYENRDIGLKWDFNDPPLSTCDLYWNYEWDEHFAGMNIFISETCYDIENGVEAKLHQGIGSYTIWVWVYLNLVYLCFSDSYVFRIKFIYNWVEIGLIILFKWHFYCRGPLIFNVCKI